MDVTRRKRAAGRKLASGILPRAELMLTGFYLFGAMFWSIYSNQYISARLADEEEFPMQVAAKGINFVLTTGAVLYLVLRRTESARRAAESRPPQELERFALVARAASDAVWDWDLRHNRVWRSGGYWKLFGYSLSELPGGIESWIDRLHPEDQDRVVTGLRQAVRSDQPSWADEYRFRAKDGRYLDVADRAYVLRAAEGEPIRVIGRTTDITQRRHTEQEMFSFRERLRALSARVQNLREEERIRTSRVIRDELGQGLSDLETNLRWMEEHLSAVDGPAVTPPIVDRIKRSTGLVDRLRNSTERITSELRPDVLDSQGLLSALEFELDRFRKLTGVETQCDLPESLPPLPIESRTAVFRIFQETLANVARHARASCVEVSLRLAAGRARLRVRDNGQGMPPDRTAASGSLGLLEMQQRAVSLNGTVQIESAPGAGTTLSLDFPLPPSPSSQSSAQDAPPQNA